MQAQAHICCLDLDTFFVSVERLLDPSLEGKPVVVGASPGKRGVVTAASYEVRAFGVRSGMSMRDATRLAPHAIFLPTRHRLYTPYAKQVRTVLERFTPLVQTASIDEFYLDFAGCERLYGRPGDTDPDVAIARAVACMRQAVQDDVGLPASAGLGGTRPIAKIASRLAKPAGVCQLRPHQAPAVIGAMSVRAWPGIGPSTEARLTAAGVLTIEQLLSLPPGPHRAAFGGLSNHVRRGLLGGQPQRRGRAVRDRPAFREHDPQGLAVGSISNERTFMADLRNHVAVDDQLRALCERVAWRSRKRQVRARTLTLKIRFSDFETRTRSRTLPATDDEAVLLGCARALLAGVRPPTRAVRLLGIGLSKLVGVDRQLALPFAGDARPRAARAVDAIRSRFGFDAIRLGATAGSPRDDGPDLVSKRDRAEPRMGGLRP